MTQTPLNIIDLLMGDLSGPGAGGIVGNAAGAPQDPGLFGDIINSYLSLTGQEKNLFNQAKCVPGAAENQLDMLTAKTPDNVAEFNRQLMATAPQQTNDNVAEFNRQLMAMLPQQTSDIGANIKDLLNHLPTELEPGKYEILSSQVQDGTVSLEVAGKDNPLQTVKLTLPLEDLKISGNARQNGQSAFGSDLMSQRVALGTENHDTSRLNDILSRLNLKEIEVKSVNVSKTTTESGEPLKISIVAEGTAGEMMIKGKLEKSRVRAIPTTPVKGSESAKAQSIEAARPILSSALSTQPDNDYLQGKLLSGNAKANTNIGTRTMVAESDIFDSLTSRNSGLQRTEAQQLYDNVFGYETAGADEKSATESTSGKAIRLTLPQNLNSMLKPNGRAITLQIEPENLGPAKLSLSMVGDKLRARIVVESAPAKTALEADVDRLMSQLSKADIKVDHIEITLSQDNAHNEFLRRQPHWQHRMVNRMPDAEDVHREQAGIPETMPIAATREYVGPAGVNVFA